MSFSELLSSGFAVLRRNLRQILVITLGSYLLIFAVLFLVGRTVLYIGGNAGNPIDPISAWRGLGAIAKSGVILSFILTMWIPQLLSCTGIAWIARRETVEVRPSAKNAFVGALLKLPQIVVLSIVVGVIVFVGSFLLVLPGIVASALGLMIMPVMMTQDLELGSAIRRGLKLGSRNLGGLMAVVMLEIVFAIAIYVIMSVLGATIHTVFLMLAFPVSGALRDSWAGSVFAALAMRDVPTQARIASAS